jgi:hypothetical protein
MMDPPRELRRHGGADGLPYLESEAEEIKTTAFKWINQSSLSDRYFRRFKNGNGPSSLAESATRSIVRYRYSLTVEVLREIPWDSMGKPIWERILKMYDHAF